MTKMRPPAHPLPIDCSAMCGAASSSSASAMTATLILLVIAVLVRSATGRRRCVAPSMPQFDVELFLEFGRQEAPPPSPGKLRLVVNNDA
jgi:hypothetical protein